VDLKRYDEHDLDCLSESKLLHQHSSEHKLEFYSTLYYDYDENEDFDFVQDDDHDVDDAGDFDYDEDEDHDLNFDEYLMIVD
jgi:hypothetical protein